MRLNFRKISALASSLLILGMTAGIASAANYPVPFVTSGSPNVAIVYGSGAALSDSVAGGSIATSLQSFVTGNGSSTVTTSGAVQALDQGGSNRIWLNTSLTTAKSTYTSTDFPVLLASTTFGGNVASTTTQTITLGSGAISTTSSGSADNSGKVEFAKMPTSAYDPTVGVSIGTSNFSNYLYNATVAFSQPINFTASASQGIPITLFGSQYVVATMAASATALVLYSSATTINLAQGNSTTVSVAGVSHTVSLTAVSSTQVQLTMDGTAGTVNTGTNQLVNGVSVAVTSVFPSSGIAGGSATILLGANQITFTNGSSVQVGTSNTPVLGTIVYFTGSLSALSGLTVQVQAPLSTNASLLSGLKFVDPVFGSFQLINSGLNNPIDKINPQRDKIVITPSGQTATIAFTDLNGYNASIPFTYNTTGKVNLTYGGATYNSPIYVNEMANLSFLSSLTPVVLTGTGTSGQLEGHMIQLQSIYNGANGMNAMPSGTNYSSDTVSLYDVITGASYNLKGSGTASVNGNPGLTTATFTLDGKTYTVYWENSSWAEIRYTSDSGAIGSGNYLLYPAISTQNHGQIILYGPLGGNFSSQANLSLTNIDGLSNNVTTFFVPYGGGFTSITFTPLAVTPTGAFNGTNFTVSISGGTGTVQGSSNFFIPNNVSVAAVSGATTINVTVGSSKNSNLTFEFVADNSNLSNRTDVYLVTPGGVGTALGAPIINNTAVVLLENRDVNSNYNAFVVQLSGISSSSGGTLGVSSIVSTTSTTNYTTTLFSDSNVNVWVDFWGTNVTRNADSSTSPFAIISYPLNQVYEQLFLGAINSSVISSGGGALGSVLVTDTQVGTVGSKNLVVVGGSCINTVAATLVGGKYCGSAWTTATGVGTGQFLIKSYATSSVTSQLALLVAGYEAADTTNAATYLSTQAVDTTKLYRGTSGTQATLSVQ